MENLHNKIYSSYISRKCIVVLCECAHVSVGVGATQGHGNDKHGPPVTVIADMGKQERDCDY